MGTNVMVLFACAVACTTFIILRQVLPRRFRILGLLAFYLGVLPLGIATMFGIRLNSPNPPYSNAELTDFLVSALAWFFSSIVFLSAVARPVLLARRTRPVPPYWLWVVMVFAVIAMVPLYPVNRPGLPGGTQFLQLASVYPFGDTDVYPFLHGQAALLVHTLVALLVAIPAAARHTIIRRSGGSADPVRFSLRQLLGGMAVLALVFAFLAWCAAPPVLYCVAVLFYGGWPATLILAGLFESRVRRPELASGSSAKSVDDSGTPGVGPQTAAFSRHGQDK